MELNTQNSTQSPTIEDSESGSSFRGGRGRGSRGRGRGTRGRGRGGGGGRGGPLQKNVTTEPSTQSEITKMFQVHSQILDERNDRREKIYQISRDIGKSSKRVISLLHRCTDQDNRAATIQQAEKEFPIVQGLLIQILKNLSSDDHWRFNRSFSPGLQEYVEAYSFYYYLLHGKLVSKTEIEIPLQDLQLPLSDYLLGICDLAGELMRYATNSVSVGDFLKPKQISEFMNSMYQEFQKIKFYHGEFKTKLDVIRESAKKIEVVCYKLYMREQEYPLESLRQAILESSIGRSITTDTLSFRQAQTSDSNESYEKEEEYLE